MIRIETPRDVLLLRDDAHIIVSSVDSCGGIGELPSDTLYATLETVGAYTARTALLEVLCIGAKPDFVSIAACNGPETANRLITGVRSVVGDMLPLVISTEKNIQSNMTALGVSITGSCHYTDLRLCGANQGDWLYCAGLPLVGAEILTSSSVLPGINYVRQLLEDPSVHTLIPVGSQGIAAEAHILEKESGLHVHISKRMGIDLQKSAGPSSCLLFAASANPDHFMLSIPITPLGKFGQ